MFIPSHKSRLQAQSSTTEVPPNDDTTGYIYHVKHTLPKDKPVEFNASTPRNIEIYNIPNTWYDHIEPNTHMRDYLCVEDTLTSEKRWLQHV